MSSDPFPAIISHLVEIALSLPGKNRPVASRKSINWVGWQAPAHQPEASSEHVMLSFSLRKDIVRCMISVQINAKWKFRAIGPTAEADHSLDGLEALVKEASAIAQWMTPPKGKK